MRYTDGQTFAITSYVRAESIKITHNRLIMLPQVAGFVPHKKDNFWYKRNEHTFSDTHTHFDEHSTN